MTAVQWVQLGPDELLMASRTSAWIQRREPGTMWLGRPMPPSVAADRETTRWLLDGALAAAERTAPGVSAPQMTQRRWAWQLAGQWYTAHHSIALIGEVAARFDAEARTELAQFAWRKFEEERGHDQLALTDLRDLGYDAEALVRSVTPPIAAAAVEFARGCARGAHPIDFVGYVHVIERDVTRLTDAWFAALDAVLPAGADAAAGLRSHATDLDIDHVDQAFEFFAGLSAAERTRIAVACYRTATILYTPLRGQHPSEAELERRLAPFVGAEGTVDTSAATHAKGA